MHLLQVWVGSALALMVTLLPYNELQLFFFLRFLNTIDLLRDPRGVEACNPRSSEAEAMGSCLPERGREERKEGKKEGRKKERKRICFKSQKRN